ncbi:hypothetical protein TNCT_358261 [Trichonephila clavata]|uniref:Uncharacterized protein n=1 Tax=Trichonephila clavata TaxID=2740835 RepID=A0A8X6KD81_TRICU|nr:hypothetical protein TNCT_358261 [Trichonephila clavata]
MFDITQSKLFVEMTVLKYVYFSKHVLGISCGRVDPRPLPSPHDALPISPDPKTWQMNPFHKGSERRRCRNTSPGLSRILDQEWNRKDRPEELRVADLQVVFLGQRCCLKNSSS